MSYKTKLRSKNFSVNTFFLPTLFSNLMIGFIYKQNEKSKSFKINDLKLIEMMYLNSSKIDVILILTLFSTNLIKI